MTTTRDADRIVRAWLELMPDEAPDRTVAAVLQAVEATPQMRRPVLHGPRRSDAMNRFSLIAVAAVLGAAVVGVALFAGGSPGPQPAPTTAAIAPNVAPSPSIEASPAGDTSTPAALVATWFGPHRDVPAIATGSGSRLVITDTGLAFGPPNNQALSLLSAALAGSAGDTLTVRSGRGSCAANDTGTYRWSLSSGGNVLAITSTGDSCALRAAAFEGTWWKAGCKIGPTCLGDTEAGTYASQFFNPGHNQAGEWTPLFGGIGYTVPGGWANAADWPSRFILTPSSSYANVAADGSGPDGVIHEIAVYAQPAAALQDGACGSVADPAVKPSVADLERWIAGLPDVVTTAAAPITIDSHQGRMLDLHLRAGATARCPGEMSPSVEILAGAGQPSDGTYGIGLFEGERLRLILLDTGGSIVAILVDDQNDTLGADVTRFQSLVDAAMPVVESFTFK